MNKTAKTAARKTVNVLMLVILAFLTTLPIFWCIITSLKTPQDISAYPPKIFNFTVTWNNYKQVFAQSFLQTAGNSVSNTAFANARIGGSERKFCER